MGRGWVLRVRLRPEGAAGKGRCALARRVGCQGGDGGEEQGAGAGHVRPQDFEHSLHRLRRHPLAYWAAVLVAALLAARLAALVTPPPAGRQSPHGAASVGSSPPPSLADGERALAVPLGDTPIALHRGDTVDVLGTFDVDAATNSGAAASADTGPTVVIATGATVLDVTDRAATIAVPIDLVPKVAFALAKGTVTLARSPGPQSNGD